jgi:membrane-bound serine protease (ClpP class)
VFLILAAVCGAAFLFCQFYLDLAGAPEVILIVLGVAALAAEIFLFPTGGFLALAGAALILVGLVLAFMPDGIQFQPGTDGWGAALGLALKGAVWAIIIFTGGLVAIIATLHRTVPKTLASPVAIDTTSAGAVEAAAATLAGKRGVARTMLRPAGFVVVEGQDLAATTEHGVMVDAGAAIEVVEARFGELIVRPTPGQPS